MDNAASAEPTRLPAEPSTVETAPPPAALFRQEAVEEQQPQRLGAVLLQPRISDWTVAGLSLLTAAAVLCLLFFGSYTSKAAVSGWLVPRQGLVRVFAPQAGLVASVTVAEGAKVSKGAKLLAISTELQSQTIGATREEMLRKLRERRASTLEEKTIQERLFDEQFRDLTQRLAAMREEEAHLAQEGEIQGDQLSVAERALHRTQQLRRRGLVTEPAAEKAEQDRLEHTSKLYELERLRDVLRRNQSELQSQLQQLPLMRQTRLGEIERNVSSLDQELADLESQREIVLVAPEDGTVTGIQVSPGGNVSPNYPLLSIVPAGSVLQAELYGPSRAVGFLRAGQPVLLKYRAFPYQKFGFYNGVVQSVSRSAMSPSELPQGLAELSAGWGAGEPLYRIVVELAQQTVVAYGAAVPLQPGMQVDADILLEKRRLFEWILDPLFTVTGTWR